MSAMALSGVSETGAPQCPQKTFPLLAEEIRVLITIHKAMIEVASVTREIRQITV
jgi:hypothetical protein